VERLRLAELVVARAMPKMKLRPIAFLPDGDDVEGGGFGLRGAVETMQVTRKEADFLPEFETPR